MSERLLAGFTVALAFSLAVTPLLRSLALKIGIVDRPAARKVHTREVAYLGGLAIASATLVGLLIQNNPPSRIGVLAIAAVGLGVVGLLDDDRTLAVSPRVIAQLVAAVAAVAAGVRARPTGIVAYDIAITVVWIVGITNALNLLDNVDGLAAGVAASIAAGVALLGGFGGQRVVGGLGAALLGACLGFLAFNWRPASIFMGDAGALFLGFTIAIATLELRPSITRPGSLFVPLALVAIPILDTATVVLARRRRGIPVARGGKDHLSHRLIALGLSPSGAVLVLIAAQLIFGTVAVFVGRGVTDVGRGVVVVGLGLGGLSWLTGRANVYTEAVRQRTRRIGLLALGVSGLAVGLSAPAAVATWQSRNDVLAARSRIDDALDAMRDGNVDRASQRFGDAEFFFRRAQSRLASPFARLGGLVPIIGGNVNATRTIVDAGVDVSSAGRRLALSTNPDQFAVARGTVPIAQIARVAPDLESAAATLDDARRRMARVDDAYLVPTLRDAVVELRDKLDEAQRDADRAALAARLVPRIFGADGPRRYFLAVQNSAELRATGGFIGNWGILDAADGHVELGEFDRIEALNLGGTRNGRVIRVPEDFRRRYQRFAPESTWQNVNMSPDFPTSARVIDQLLPQSGGPDVDGVIAVDPSGLAALLELAGPVRVSGWPIPIDSANVVRVTLSDAYENFEQAERVEFLGDVARAVWRAVTSRRLGSPTRLASALGGAIEAGHLMVWMADETEQGLVRDTGLSGSIPATPSDSLLLVTQNAAGNKADYYLRRSIRYTAQVAPMGDGRRAMVAGSLAIELENEMPATGLPRIVMGPYRDGFVAGENRSYVSAYTQTPFVAATLDGSALGMEAASELGRTVASTYISIPSKSTRSLELRTRGAVALDGGWYRLDVFRQPVLAPDHAEIVVRAAPGWRIIEARGAAVADGVLRWSGALTDDRAFSVRLARGGVGGLIDRLNGR